MKLPNIFEDRNGELFIDKIAVEKLALKYDTPLYVVSQKRIKENYTNLYNALKHHYRKVRIHYAVKANSNIAILRILKQLGAHIDAVSPGEVFLAFKAGYTSNKILFTGTSVRDDELKFLLNNNVTVNIDSLSQLQRLLNITTPKILSIRLNPVFGAGHHEHCITAGRNSKFGLWEEDFIRAYEIAVKKGVEKFGLHMHIGSGILTVEPYILAVNKLLSTAKKIHEKTEIEFEFINIGGGMGVPYRQEDKELNLKFFFKKIAGLFKSKIKEYDLGEPTLCIEPGRYIVADACLLLTRVNTIKITPYKKFAGVDAGFNVLVRPVMYGSYHHIIVNGKLHEPAVETYDVAGPLCESGDLLALDRKLPHLEEGDLLAILNGGAYCFSMSSQYNSRPRPAEVLIKDEKHHLIRKRETFDDLIRSQQL